MHTIVVISYYWKMLLVGWAVPEKLLIIRVLRQSETRRCIRLE